MSQELEESSPREDLESSMTSATAETPMLDGNGEVVVDAPASAPAAAAPAGASPAEWQGVLDYARSQGVQLPYRDDRAATDGLIQAYRVANERNYYSDLGRQMAPYASQIEAWIRQNQAAQYQQQQQRPQYAPPPWDPKWVSMVERDPNTGMLRSKAGYDPRIADAVQQYADWRDKFLENPAQTITPLVEERARSLIQQEMATHKEALAAEQLVAQNANWIFQSSADGRPILGQDGMKTLSPAGHLYAQAINHAWNAGLRDIRQMDGYGRTVVENAVLRQQYLQFQQGAAGTPAAQAQGQIAPSVGGSNTRHSPSLRRQVESKKGLTLRETLDAAVKGFPEEDANL